MNKEIDRASNSVTSTDKREVQGIKVLNNPDDGIFRLEDGLKRGDGSFDEVYWKRLAQDGTVYIKRMTPNGTCIVLEDTNGVVRVNEYNMKELVFPVPNKWSNFFKVFRPTNFKLMRNYEYLEEEFLKVGQVDSDGTKVIRINVVEEKMTGEDPDLLREIRARLTNAKRLEGALARRAFMNLDGVDQPQQKKKLVFGESDEDKQISLEISLPEVDGQQELYSLKKAEEINYDSRTDYDLPSHELISREIAESRGTEIAAENVSQEVFVAPRGLLARMPYGPRKPDTEFEEAISQLRKKLREEHDKESLKANENSKSETGIVDPNKTKADQKGGGR